MRCRMSSGCRRVHHVQRRAGQPLVLDHHGWNHHGLAVQSSSNWGDFETSRQTLSRPEPTHGLHFSAALRIEQIGGAGVKGPVNCLPEARLGNWSALRVLLEQGVVGGLLGLSAKVHAHKHAKRLRYALVRWSAAPEQFHSRTAEQISGHAS